MNLPTHAQVLIVGGGIAGCSTAYHLTKLGITDVLLLEQGQLTSGTTWHAAGLIGQMRPNRNMTRMSKYGIELYSTLEQETGLATGWKQCGSVNVARTPERMQVLRKQAALARSFGVEVQLISPREAGELYPVMRTDDLQGAIWIPGDGKANPADLCMSLAKGARQRGARLVEGVEVVGVLVDDGPVGGAGAGASGRAGTVGPRAVGVRVRQGDEIVEIRCETLVNCGGQWARQFGALAGVSVPLYPAEHFYIVTDRIEGVHPMLPVMRDPDGYIYYKEEVGGLLMGGFEPVAKPWTVDPIPSSFQFQLLGEDWDQFEPLMRNAIHRTPCLETAKVKMLLNGPESFTPDGNFILGEAPELRQYYVCAGFNSAGIANSGGAGQLIAQWIAAGEPPGDLWDVDIRRFGPHNANRRALAERTGETLGLHYAMRWPRQELQTTRPLRTSPLYDLLAGGARPGPPSSTVRSRKALICKESLARNLHYNAAARGFRRTPEPWAWARRWRRIAASVRWRAWSRRAPPGRRAWPQLAAGCGATARACGRAIPRAGRSSAASAAPGAGSAPGSTPARARGCAEAAGGTSARSRCRS